MMWLVVIIAVCLVADGLYSEHKRRKRLRDLVDHPTPVVHQDHPCVVSAWSNCGDLAYECASPRNEEGCDFYEQSKRTYTCAHRREHRSCSNEDAHVSALADKKMEEL